MIKEYQIIRNDEGNLTLDLRAEMIDDIDYVYDNCEINIEAIGSIFREYYNLDKSIVEKSYCIALDYNRNILGIILISSGDSRSCDMYNKLIGSFALLTGADEIITIHNHPNNNNSASKADIKSNERIKKIAELLEIEFNYNLILTKDDVINFCDEKILEEVLLDEKKMPKLIKER